MIKLDPPFRQAVQDDARLLADFVNMAGEGLPLYLWEQMATDSESPWDIGSARARRDSGGFSYRNAAFRTVDGEIAACLIGYPLEDSPSASDYSDLPPMFVPLQQLEDLVPGTWYINVLATLPAHRCKGYGRELLRLAECICTDLGKRGLSLIVANTNEGARHLYRANGYQDVASRSMVKERWQHPGANWVLMQKDLKC